MADDKASGGGFVTGLLLGILAGATLAMIASPQSGEETRSTLRAKAREAADRARDTAGEVSEAVGGQTNELLERGRAIVERARARVDEAVAEGMEAAAEQRNELESRT
jgi:gas vesicle protein